MEELKTIWEALPYMEIEALEIIHNNCCERLRDTSWNEKEGNILKCIVNATQSLLEMKE